MKSDKHIANQGGISGSVAEPPFINAGRMEEMAEVSINKMTGNGDEPLFPHEFHTKKQLRKPELFNTINYAFRI